MVSSSNLRMRCNKCGKLLGAIWFTSLMTEEWIWNGEGNNECSAHHSLVTDSNSRVICPNCEHVVGVGREFGFG
jgi:hypothetical protein